MTKIKDLVTVTVRTAEATFLIDEERYELLDLFHMFPTPEEVWNERVIVTDQIDRQKAFLEDVSMTFQRAARVYVCSQNERPLTTLDADLARRCEASITEFVLEAVRRWFFNNDEAYVYAVAALLWEGLRVDLERSGFRRLEGYVPFNRGPVVPH
jgi:hypothetical protein